MNVLNCEGVWSILVQHLEENAKNVGKPFKLLTLDAMPDEAIHVEKTLHLEGVPTPCM